MGSTVSSDISRVDVSKSPSGQEQSVVYSTPNSRTCTLRVSVGADSASVTLRDYTFDTKGTRVNLSVRDTETKEGSGGVGVGVGTVDGKYWGSVFYARNNDSGLTIVYGVPRVRCNLLVAEKYRNDKHGPALFVTHVCGIGERRLSLVVVHVWYDAGKGAFMYNVTGPSRHSSVEEVRLAAMKVFAHSVDLLNRSRFAWSV